MFAAYAADLLTVATAPIALALLTARRIHEVIASEAANPSRRHRGLLEDVQARTHALSPKPA